MRLWAGPSEAVKSETLSVLTPCDRDDKAFRISPSVAERETLALSSPRPSNSEKEEPLPPTTPSPDPALLFRGGRIRPWGCAPGVFTNLWAGFPGVKTTSGGQVVRLSVSPSRESCSWAREDKEESVHWAGFLWISAYRAFMSSHKGAASRLSESTEKERSKQNIYKLL